MVLTSHVVVGAAVSSLVPGHPVAGFAVGFLSHYLLDMIPHRDYLESDEDEGLDSKASFEKKSKGKYCFYPCNQIG